MKAPSDARALQGLSSSVLFAEVDETGHLVLRDFNLLATERSERDIC